MVTGRTRASLGTAVALGTTIEMALVPCSARAATITVSSTADNTTAGDATCTLREAIANVNAVGDTTSGDCAANRASKT
jgi:CSLREA domain-containing protein